MKVPYLDLNAQHSSFRREIDDAIKAVLDSSDFVVGVSVERFERSFAKYCGVDYCIGVSNGTDALLLALLSVGVKKGDEVITATNSFVATAEAIVHAGAEPVFVDVDPATRNIDTELALKAVNKRTKAIIPIHLFGRVADMQPLVDLGANEGIAIIEDASQAHGATWQGKRAGSLGELGTFSFYPGKNLGAIGDAGAVTTSDPAIANHVRQLRDHGAMSKSQHLLVGYNARLNGLQAAILELKLKRLDRWNEKRREIAGAYCQLLSNSSVGLPSIDDSGQVFHIFAIEVDGRDDLRSFLTDRDIGTGIHYPLPIHLLPSFSYLGYSEGAMPVAEALSQRMLSLPIYPEMSMEQVSYVANSILEFLERG